MSERLSEAPLITLPDGVQVRRDSQQFDRSLVDPLAILVPFLSQDPDWVVLGGLGNCDEITPARKRWPQTRFIGIDPDPKALRWQYDHCWPFRKFREDVFHPTLCAALSDSEGEEPVRLTDICHSSLHPHNLADAPEHEIHRVRTTTLDAIDRDFGPFVNCVIWLDCEGYDLKALVGGTKLLHSGRVRVVNFEVRYSDSLSTQLAHVLSRCGFQHCMTWFRQWWGHNEVWRPRIQEEA